MLSPGTANPSRKVTHYHPLFPIESSIGLTLVAVIVESVRFW
jgi:hypothetical protein